MYEFKQSVTEKREKNSTGHETAIRKNKVDTGVYFIFENKDYKILIRQFIFSYLNWLFEKQSHKDQMFKDETKGRITCLLLRE